MRFNLSAAFPFLVVTLLLAAGLFHFAFSRVASDSLPVGCSPQTSDGQTQPGQTVAFWQNRPLEPPLALVPSAPSRTRVLGTSTADDSKWIEIDLTKQLLVAHDGSQIFLTSPISSGLYYLTPTGEYRIWYKIASTLMTGGIKGQPSYYYLPNVPYTMFFYGDYGIHGTYWHHNFGHPMSHGCVNAPTPVAEQLFYWAGPVLPPGERTVRSTAQNPGTRVIVHN